MTVEVKLVDQPAMPEQKPNSSQLLPRRKKGDRGRKNTEEAGPKSAQNDEDYSDSRVPVYRPRKRA